MHGVSYQTGEVSKEFGDPGVRVPGLLKQSKSWAFLLMTVCNLYEYLAGVQTHPRIGRIWVQGSGHHLH